jgi:flagellar biosynthesis protein FliR
VNLVELSVSHVYGIAIVFCRIGSAAMFLPLIGEMSVSPAIRLLIAIALSALIAPALSDIIPALPSSAILLSILIFSEISIGVVIGLITKLIFSSIHTLGLIIATQSSLASAMLFDPSQGTQGSIFGNFFALSILVLLLSLNLHLDIIKALTDSYKLFAIGSFGTHLESFTQTIIHTASDAFNVGVKLSAPFMITGLLVYIGSGVLSRLMPQFQIFFLILPAQILISFIIMLLVFSSTAMWFVDYYQQTLLNIFGS